MDAPDDDRETTPELLIARTQALMIPADPASLILADDALDAAVLLLRELRRR